MTVSLSTTLAAGGAAASASVAGRPGAARVARIDALRAVAVLLVMLRHLPLPSADQPRLVAFMQFVKMPAWLGVDLFFVLSGFLVSGLLFKEFRAHGRISAGRFLIRRGFKIYPSYYVFVIGTYLFATFPRAPQLKQLLAYSLFVQNYLVWMPGPWVHLWSVAVEEHFYLLLVAVMAWRLRPGRAMPSLRGVLWTLGLVLATVQLARILSYAPPRDANDMLALSGYRFFRTHLRLDALLLGVGLAYVYHERPLLWARLAARRRLLQVGGIVALLPAFRIDFLDVFTPVAGFTLYYFAWGAILVATLGEPARRETPVGWETWLARMGAYSYSIYLWHMAAPRWIMPAVTTALGGRLPYALEVLATVALSVALGVVMARLIEVPALALRDRLFPSRSGASLATGPATAGS